MTRAEKAEKVQEALNSVMARLQQTSPEAQRLIGQLEGLREDDEPEDETPETEAEEA